MPGTDPAPAIEAIDIVQEYPAPDGNGVIRVLDGVNLTVQDPGIYMLMGPSGCGKSTLMRLFGGVRPFNVKSPTAGKVFLGKDVCHDAHDDAVMVFQKPSLRPDLTVRENVGFAFRFKLWKNKVPAEEREQRVSDMLAAVGLSDKADLRPYQLSGGQQQRVALAQALVLRPHYLLMDEPFSALDPQTRHEMQELLVGLWERQKCVVIFITHDVDEALVLGDRILVLSNPPAKLVGDFEINTPRDQRSALWARGSVASAISQKIVTLL